MSNMISPISFHDPQIMSISLQVNNSEIEKREESFVECSSSLGIDRKYRIADMEDGDLLADCVLDVHLIIKERQSDDREQAELLEFKCIMQSLATSPHLGEDRETSEKILVANAISYIWGKMRALFDLLISDTAVPKGLSLPAIDPYSLLEDDE